MLCRMSNGINYVEPNVFELQGGGLTVHYAKSSLAGVPLLTFNHRGMKKSYRGEEVRTTDTELGRLVTVLVEAVPDLHTITLTLVVPAVNVSANEEPVQTFAVFTTELTSIAGPRLVKGQIDRYETVHLAGKALAPEF
jgi:hypothetical protein